MPDTSTIILNEAGQRFEWPMAGHLAYVQFERLPGAIAYTHTIVPKELGGKGIGGALVRHVMDDARGKGLKVRPDCSFVQAFIERHPEYQSMSLAPGADTP